MTIFNYTGPLLGGTQAGMAAQEGQYPEATYGALGAYNAANNSIVKNGGTALPGASAVGKWLPYIGMGLATYDFLSGDINLDTSTNFALTGAALFGHPAYAVPALIHGVGEWRGSEEYSKAHKYINIVSPDIELMGSDESGDYYFHYSGTVGNSGFLKYDPITNELEQLMTDNLVDQLGVEHSTTHPSADFASFLHNATVEDIQNMNWEKFNPQLDQGEVGAYGVEKPYILATVADMPAIQAQIYNQVLLPEGYAPPPDIEKPINVHGKEYYVDDAGMVYRSNGQIAGLYDSETNSVKNLAQRGKVRLHTDGRIDEAPRETIAEVTDAPAYVPSDDVIVMSGLGEFDPTLAPEAGWNDTLIHNNKYRLDDETRTLYFGDKPIGTVDSENTAYDLEGNVLGRATVLRAGEQIDVGMGGYYTPEENAVFLDINPNYEKWLEGNVARTQDQSIDPNTFNLYASSSQSPDPNSFRWNTQPEISGWNPQTDYIPVTSPSPELPQFQPQGVSTKLPNMQTAHPQIPPQFMMPQLGTNSPQGPFLPQLNQGDNNMALPPFVQQGMQQNKPLLPQQPMQPKAPMGGNLPWQQNSGMQMAQPQQQAQNPMTTPLGQSQPQTSTGQSSSITQGLTGQNQGQQSLLPNFLNIMKMLVQSGQLRG
jgi:hypothetical protein